MRWAASPLVAAALLAAEGLHVTKSIHQQPGCLIKLHGCFQFSSCRQDGQRLPSYTWVMFVAWELYVSSKWLKDTRREQAALCRRSLSGTRRAGFHLWLYRDSCKTYRKARWALRELYYSSFSSHSVWLCSHSFSFSVLVLVHNTLINWKINSISIKKPHYFYVKWLHDFQEFFRREVTSSKHNCWRAAPAGST